MSKLCRHVSIQQIRMALNTWRISVLAARDLKQERYTRIRRGLACLGQYFVRYRLTRMLRTMWQWKLLVYLQRSNALCRFAEGCSLLSSSFCRRHVLVQLRARGLAVISAIRLVYRPVLRRCYARWRMEGAVMQVRF